VERGTGIGGWYEANLGLELEPWKGSVLRSSGGETLIWSLFEASTDYSAASASRRW
jgi:hypothetical protein